VELSLVAGAPHSFIQQLSEPFYGRRPVVALPESVQLSPQTHAAMLTGGNGRLNGMVTDPMGAGIPGADVRLMDENNAVIATTNTESDGQYTFSGVSPGTYRVEMEHLGFRKTAIAGLNVTPGENHINTQLQLGAVAETVEVAADSPVLNTTTSSSIANRLSSVANRPHIYTSTGSGAGMGGGDFRAGVTGASMASLEEARALGQAAASGQDLGDLFEYKLKDRVTLKKNQSGLVPIVQTDIEAEKISLWSGTSGSGRPLRGLWLKNTSALTLDGGSFSVLDKEVFAGEGLTDPIKPGERRLISYATDLGLLVEAVKNGQPQHFSQVKISHGVLTHISELRERTLYTARNQGETAQTLVIEHPARTEWRLPKGARGPDEKAPGVYRFQLEVPPQGTASMPVEEVRTLATSYQLAKLDENQISAFVKQGTITREMEHALAKITAQKAEVARLEEEMESRQKDIDRIVEDQGRLRENMKALKGTAEEKALVQRYTRQLDEQETQLESLRKNIKATEAQRDKANAQLENMIQDLQIEASI
jgi:hypothetical protein